MIRFLCFAVCLALLAEARGDDGYFRLQPAFQTSLRGQSPDGIEPPLLNGLSGAGIYDPFNSPPPSTLSLPNPPQEPYLSPPADFSPSPFQPIYGAMRQQPYRNGWTPMLNMGYLPSSNTTPDVGNFSAFELDSAMIFSMPLGPGLIFRYGSEFNYRHWDVTNLFEKDLFRFGHNFQLATPSEAPWGWQLTFDPSFNTDFGSDFSSETMNWDANGTMFWRLDPTITLIAGVGYLDRVHNIVIPYGGLIYNPNDLWEFRLLFPQGRISRFIGNFWWGSHWLYLGWEYHVEAYQIALPGNPHDQVQLEDYRLTFGLRSDHQGFTKFIEAGYVFGRNVDFKRAYPGFDISDGFMVRGGIRF